MKAGPAVEVPKKGKKGKFELQISCANTPCDFNGKLQLDFNTARKLNRHGLTIAKFEGTTGEESHRLTLKVPNKVRKAAREAEMEKLKVRTTVVVADSAGFEARTRGKVKVGI